MRNYTKAVKMLEHIGKTEEEISIVNERIIELTSTKESLNKEKRTVLTELKSMGIIVKEVL